ncbi:uncharacterized protein PG986_002897 [Apiospora aurea]|uniref:Uncharacterized protein n=1 Tax=Apiospora aurea TaxID=335848 RepID=A0ABR1QQ55_9PEZI
MTAATLARPRMPFFLGFTPAAFPLWVVCLVGFTPELLQWSIHKSGYPQWLQAENRKKQAQANMAREQHGQAIAHRAAELREYGEHQAPKTEEQRYDGGEQPPREVGSQGPNGPPRRNEPAPEEESARERECRQPRGGTAGAEVRRRRKYNGRERVVECRSFAARE